MITAFFEFFGIRHPVYNPPTIASEHQVQWDSDRRERQLLPFVIDRSEVQRGES